MIAARFERVGEFVAFHYPANGCAPTGYVLRRDELDALATALRIARWGWANGAWLRDHAPTFGRRLLPEELAQTKQEVTT